MVSDIKKNNLEDYIIDSNCTLLDAIEKMANNERKALVVIENGIVYGVFTRRDLLNCCHVFSFDVLPLKPYINRKFTFFKNAVDQELSVQYHSIIPVLDENGRLLDIFFPSWKKKGEYAIPTVIMAGGKGTRLFPFTKDIPKPLVPVVKDKVMMDLVLNSCHQFGTHDYYIIVNHLKEKIIEYYKEVKLDFSLHFITEEMPLGTGGGLGLLKGKIDSTFFLSNCDILVQENYDEIYEYHKATGNAITIVAAIQSVRLPYGVLSVDKKLKFLSSTEKPTYLYLANTGVYVVSPQVFNFIGENEKVDFPSVIERMKSSGEKVGIYPVTGDKWIDMGQIDELEHAKEVLKKQIDSN